MIPRLIVLKAGENRYVLISLSLGEYIEASLVNNPKYLFSSAEWRSDGVETKKDLKFKRISSRSSPKIYNTTLTKTTNYVIVPWEQPIHIYTMTYAGTILPSTYFKVFKGDDVEEKWHFKKSAGHPSLVVHPSPVESSKIPTHIIRGFVESAIQKKETCPITLETLVMGNIAMTPCGHLFDKDALIHSINRNAVCPSCRSCVKDGIVTI